MIGSPVIQRSFNYSRFFSDKEWASLPKKMRKTLKREAVSYPWEFRGIDLIREANLYLHEQLIKQEGLCP